MDKFFKWLPEEIRQQELDKLKGQKYIFFPVAYFKKAGNMAMSPLWINLTSVDSDGMIAKSAPKHFIEKFAKTLDKAEIEYQIGIIE
jgi:hypothetical protein